MRHIDVEQLASMLPEKWEKRAREATEEVRVAAPDQRSATLEKHANLWRELNEILARLSNGKCWYCESKQDRSDKSVDHYRPKNRVAECPDHPGYWWLAFDWRNYRFSCTYCNSLRRNRIDGSSGGKHDRFPLLDEEARARTEEDDLKRENPMLLDPTSAFDTTLLYFQEDGQPIPRCGQSQVVQFERAKTSIRLYHLDHPDIVEARKVLFNEIRKLVETGNDLFDHMHERNPESRRALAQITKTLMEKIDGKAEHSKAVRDMIRGLRDPQHSWIDGLSS